ncbi:aminotransferase class V-fold PLP-dependent enzyme [Ornithinimicrobium sp. F0845]|uniref:aminotransferase class V-fold PLP-dependent enzyme n=1 Tax=Ornithinimicrobium sp. F0845 TaxID=2926412 RepID=UPI001FF57E7E|nr:aminotransferase class V-fold PLP-dependent enzyme [Ornithinimicrobium sp. F0845]MCK0114153.1 aminotransferase class V-fold PLP-dependent enzyme [Ornithinimicrobium sp. F0845]
MTTVTDRTAAELAKKFWKPAPGYLNAATLGLPPRPVVDAMQDALLRWQAGEACPVEYGELAERARRQYAELVGVQTSSVALGSQASVLVGTVATSVPDGAEILCVTGDFTSVTFPFQVQERRGATVRHVPLADLADAVTAKTHLVAFSLAQSSTGDLVDVPAVTQAAAEHGAMTLCDTTQATGWMPVDAGLFDLTVCSAYKWLCQPRGTAYLTVRPEVADRITPNNAGWYAGESVWDSVYGPEMTLAADARRFDVSLAWLCWVGAAAASEVFATLDPEQVREHDLALANALRGRLGLEPCARPVITLDDPAGDLAAGLEAAGVRCASRAGRVRLAFHVWNTVADVDLVAEALD